jgi:hypothetical protein
MVVGANPSALPNWLAAATIGWGRVCPPDQRERVAAALLTQTVVESSATAETLKTLASASRAAVTDIGASDPLPIALGQMREILTKTAGSQNAVAYLLHLVSSLDEADRNIASRVIFGISPTA